MDKNLHAAIPRISRYTFTLLLLFLFTHSFAQVKFSAAVNDRTIGKNDYLQVQFTVENASNVENINPPSFKNFTVVSGPNQQSSMSNINGTVKQSLSIGFVLQPTAPGNFTIGAATAKVDGKEYHSNPVSIQVTKSSSTNRGGNNTNQLSSPFNNLTLDFPTEPATHQFDDYILQKGENVAEKIKKNLFIRIDVSKNTCYAGEPIIATYKLYTRLKSESNVVKFPSFNGFSVSELESPDNFAVRMEKYKGREYNVYNLRKVQLYPLQSGRLSLDPVEVKNRVTFLKAEYAGRRKGDIFYDMLRDFADENAPGDATEQQIITISCDTVNINVKPLPADNRPASFKGAVGNFRIIAALEKNNITTDDAGSLKLIISGAGNLQLINAPAVIWPKGLEGFESKASENLDKLSVPMKGDKIFTYPFTISNEGDFTIPPIEFSYFDPASASYKTISTQSLFLHVLKGKGVSQKVFNSTNANINKSEPWLSFINNYIFYIAAGILLLIVCIMFFIKSRKEKKEIINENIMEPVIAEENIIAEPSPEFIIPDNPLSDVEEKLIMGDAEQFYKSLDVSLHKYLSEKLQLPGNVFTKKQINETMDKHNVSVGTSLLLNSLLEDIEIMRYAPVSSETQMQDVYEKASEVVSLLDKQV